jgi:hypothetical protein
LRQNSIVLTQLILGGVMITAESRRIIGGFAH